MTATIDRDTARRAKAPKRTPVRRAGQPRWLPLPYLLPAFAVYAAFLLYPLGRAVQLSVNYDNAVAAENRSLRSDNERTRRLVQRFLVTRVCSVCHGTRLRPQALTSQLAMTAASPRIQEQAQRQFGLVPADPASTTYVRLRPRTR